jgi:putative FmdB family regulatory protein
MPIFEFHCDNCDKTFEKLVFGGDPDVECPVCGQKDVKKLMSACAFKVDHHGFMSTPASPASKSSSSCGGCTSTNCSSCG